MIEANEEKAVSGVEQLLRDRENIDARLRNEHTRTLTIFFCDIKGYTPFTEKSGAIAARALIKRLTDIVMPAISQFHGHLVQTIGDAVMAYFEDPAQAVRFSIFVQQSLQTARAKRPVADHVHIRIGMNLGEVIFDQGNLFGDAVNLAARVEPQAQTDGILIAQNLYEAVRHSNEFDCRFAKRATLKGKSESIALYQVVWDKNTVHDYESSAQPPAPGPVAKGGVSSRLVWTAVALVVLAMIGFQFRAKLTPSSRPILDPYVSGYAALKVRDLPQAAALFQQLPSDDTRHIETSAALSLWRQDRTKTHELVGDAMKKASERIYVHVMQGDLLWQGGEVKEAAEEYRKAISLSEGLDWHRAMAHNGLGRVQASQDNLDEAQKNMAEAARLSPDDVDILTNTGVILERAGKTSEAKAYLQRAIKVKPDDALARQMLKQMQGREQLSADKARQERIDQLVSQLVSQHRSQAANPKKVNQAPGPSTGPNSLWLVGMEEKGDLPAREGEKDAFLDLLGQELQATGKVQLVERQMLDELLAELQLGSSALANPETTLTIGRLASARLLLNGHIYRQGGQILITVKVIETETSKIMASLTVELKAGESLLQAAGRLASDILARLNRVG